MYLYKILEFDNYDGDSFDLTLDLGFDIILHKKCRLYGADTAELRDKRTDFKAMAYMAKEFVADEVQDELTNNRKVYFQSENYVGKFGRPLGDIKFGEARVSLRQMLIDRHLAVPYEGQNKKEIEIYHKSNIEKLRALGKL